MDDSLHDCDVNAEYDRYLCGRCDSPHAFCRVCGADTTPCGSDPAATVTTVAELTRFVTELLEVADDFVSHEPYFAHKYGYPGLVARIRGKLTGKEPILACQPECVDCARKPQDLRDPLPDASYENHRLVPNASGGCLWTCSCGAEFHYG